MPVEIGKIYGRLEVLYKCNYFYHPPSKPNAKHSMYHVRCTCDAHKEFDVLGQSLTSGNTRSCGCLQKENKAFIEGGKKTRFQRKDKQGNIITATENEYDLSGDYGIGYTYDNHTPFYSDLEDYELIKPYLWKMKESGYVIATEYVDNSHHKTIYLHRLVMGLGDRKVDKKDVDHIFHNKTDCRKQNLRICEHYQNTTSQKTRTDNTSGRKGVCWDKTREKWIATITFNKHYYFLGRYEDFDEAVIARELAEQMIHQEYNYIESDKGYYTIEETS